MLNDFTNDIQIIKDFKINTPLPKRTLGKTGRQLSILGFGGIMLNDNSQEFANAMVAKAIEAGVNYFDVSPLYGNAEERLGEALKPYRNNCFLACKTRERLAKGAQQNLDSSLKKLKTDHFDLYQLHELSSKDEAEQVFSKNGAIHTLIKAREAGKIKHLGFSAHSVDAALFALQNFEFDSVLFPINFATWNAGNFGPQIYAEALQQGIGILAIKAMAHTTLNDSEKKVFKNVWYRPVLDEELMKMALKFTFSKHITAAIPPGEHTLFLKALELIQNISPISEKEEKHLKEIALKHPPVFSHHS